MPPFNISLSDSRIDTNRAAHDDPYGVVATNLHSPSMVSKSEQSSSSKATSKASTRNGKYSTAALQEKETRKSSETPEEKKQRRQEKKAKQEKNENEKSIKERAFSKTTKEEKKRKEEEKEKKQKKMEKKEKKEKGSKTRSKSLAEAIGNNIIESHDDHRSASVTLGQEADSKQHHRHHPTTSPRGSIHPASSSGAILWVSSVCAQYEAKNSIITEEMTGMTLDAQHLLRHKVKTLSCELKTANETIRQLDERNAQMSDLEVQFVQTEEELEYTTEENMEYSSRVRALEHALILQETELDNALTFIRQNDQARHERDLLEEEKATKPLSSEEVNEQLSKLFGKNWSS